MVFYWLIVKSLNLYFILLIFNFLYKRMKKSIVLFFASLFFSFSYSQIWVSPITSGRPINTVYLGDKLSNEWYFQFEIGQSAWNKSEVGIGQNADGTTDWNWADAEYYADGAGSNKKVQRNIGDFQFTSTGNWYVVGRARAAETDAWAYTDEGDWTDETTLTVSDTEKACPYFNVLVLNGPTSPSATVYSKYQIDLNWTKSNDKDVMIVMRKTSSSASDSPVQGTSYNVGSVLGTGRVVYKGSSTSASIAGLDANTSYTFIFYSENNNYYSEENVTAAAKTLSEEWFNDYITLNETKYALKGSGLSLDEVNLGTISSLIINSASLQYSDITTAVAPRTGSAYYYAIQENGGSNVVNDVENILTQTSLGDYTYEGSTSTPTANLISSLTAGKSYILHVWAKSWNGEDGGDLWLTNNGNNYKVSFVKSVSTGINEPDSSLKLSGENGKITAYFEGTAKVELYSATGQLIRSVKVTNVFSEAVKTGIYLLRINGTTHKVIVK
ncbi:hypothetical protein TRIP_D440091 [uncultured Paludibacter sp.]|uniref:Secretion system C-terminal sorting domain-containing protein n=1 Tax=uncultured Paludibacter sp. TaxID=497635 RepID=A0A653AJ28_9BACT|nr:hypothetical protein TRIP_D440091 [uncultured Paludibacter sp.]